MNADEFESRFRQFLPKVAKYLGYRVPSGDVEELASEIFLIAWKKQASCPDGLELPWIYKISGFVVANYRRKSLRNRSLQLFDSDLSSPSAEDVFLADFNLKNAWGQLANRDQTILGLAALEGLSVSEISTALGISNNAVSIRLHRARKNLDLLLKELEG